MLDTNALGLRTIAETPFAVVDLETTGFIPGADRVVEVAVVRVDPGEEPRLVLDTLVNPKRSMSGTEIHGLTDADVVDAPGFEEIAGDLLEDLSGCCVAAYNANFDVRMLKWEYRQLGVEIELPHLCLMAVRDDLGLGAGPLEDACRDHDVPFYAGHFAVYDALSEAELLTKLLPIFEERGIVQFGHFLSHSQRKYCESLVLPCVDAKAIGLPAGGRHLARKRDSTEVPDTRKALGLYFDALTAVVADGVVTEDEAAQLTALRERFRFRPEEVRSLHARLFGMFLDLYAEDQWLADSEAESLRKLYRCLGELGWAPGAAFDQG